MSKYPKGTKLWYEREASEAKFLKWYHQQDQQHYEKPSVTVDLIGLRFNPIKKRLEILMVKRAAHPFKDKWALPGGFLEPNETTYQAVQREVKEETQLEIDDKHIQLLPLVSTPNRDPRMWVLTNPNIVLFNMNDELHLKAGDDAAQVNFIGVSLDNHNHVQFDEINVNDIAFDHAALIQSALMKLKIEVQRKRIWNFVPLLPSKFTTLEFGTLIKILCPNEFDSYTSNVEIFKKFNQHQQMTYVGQRPSVHGRPTKVYRFVEE